MGLEVKIGSLGAENENSKKIYFFSPTRVSVPYKYKGSEYEPQIPAHMYPDKGPQKKNIFFLR